MQIKNNFPPNIELIRAVLPVPPDATFCYGDTIYNPSGKELPQDIQLHESIHSKQQGDDPETWWNRYLIDIDFRRDQEIEAYGEQFAFAKHHIEHAAEDAQMERKVLAAGKNNLINFAKE